MQSDVKSTEYRFIPVIIIFWIPGKIRKESVTPPSQKFGILQNYMNLGKIQVML